VAKTNLRKNYCGRAFHKKKKNRGWLLREERMAYQNTVSAANIGRGGKQTSLTPGRRKLQSAVGGVKKSLWGRGLGE